jgi:hypothetical protein
MGMVRFAGFDPEEDNFDGIDPAPLHEQDFQPRVMRTRMNLDRARHLRSLKWAWREIGKQIAIEEGRRVPYLANSIRLAVECNYVQLPPGQT